MALLMSMTAMASNWRVRAVKEKEMKTITIEMRDAEAFSLIDLSVAGDLEYTQSLNGKSGDVDCIGNPKIQRYDRR